MKQSKSLAALASSLGAVIAIPVLAFLFDRLLKKTRSKLPPPKLLPGTTLSTPNKAKPRRGYRVSRRASPSAGNANQLSGSAQTVEQRSRKLQDLLGYGQQGPQVGPLGQDKVGGEESHVDSASQPDRSARVTESTLLLQMLQGMGYNVLIGEDGKPVFLPSDKDDEEDKLLEDDDMDGDADRMSDRDTGNVGGYLNRPSAMDAAHDLYDDYDEDWDALDPDMGPDFEIGAPVDGGGGGPAGAFDDEAFNDMMDMMMDMGGITPDADDLDPEALLNDEDNYYGDEDGGGPPGDDAYDV